MGSKRYLNRCKSYRSGIDLPDQLVYDIYIAVVEQAFKDYRWCIKHRGIYHPVEMHGDMGYCTGIIVELYKSGIMDIFDISFEKLFKEIDKEYGYYYERLYGTSWVHPWDVVFNNSHLNDIQEGNHRRLEKP